MPEKPATYIMEVTAEAATSIKKDKTSEAVIVKMAETNRQNRSSCKGSGIWKVKNNPETCNAIQGRGTP